MNAASRRLLVPLALAETSGLTDDPIGALEATVGLIEETARGHGIEGAVHSTDGHARSLFASADVESLRRLPPDNPRFERLTPDDRLIVSEPSSDLPGVWQEIPEATAITVRRGGVLEERPFRPSTVAA